MLVELERVAADIASRVPALAQDCQINRETIVRQLIEEALTKAQIGMIDMAAEHRSEIAALNNQRDAIGKELFEAKEVNKVLNQEGERLTQELADAHSLIKALQDAIDKPPF